MISRCEPDRSTHAERWAYSPPRSTTCSLGSSAPSPARRTSGAHRDRADGSLTIAVSDDGPGIPPEELERVFERFHRVDEARARERGGTGLGLAIARAIVEAHDGHIRADSRADVGTTITLELSAYRPAATGADMSP